MSSRACLVASSLLVAATRSCVFASLLLTANGFAPPSQALLRSPPNKSVFVVPLQTQHVPVILEGRQVAVKTAFYGEIFVGGPRPQNFTVVFDTGSGHLILPSAECTDTPCMSHERYDHAASLTSTQITHDGEDAEIGLKPFERDQIQVAYGTGEVRGDFVRETVCVGTFSAKTRDNCASVRVMTALHMTEEPFNSFKFDGIVGLGLPSLALHPEFHFFGQLAEKMHIEPMFGFFLSRSDDVESEITFGGADSKRMMGGPEAIRFVPVEQPQDGYWRVQIQSVRVGSTALPLCDNGACVAIVDTGTSILGIPSEAADDFFSLTVRSLPPGTSKDELDCRHVPGPPVIFNMGDFELVLQSDEYSRHAPSNVQPSDDNSSNVTHAACHASMLPVDMPPLGERVFIWGKPVLQKYYSTYDVKGQRVGFVLAQHPSPEERQTRETPVAQASAEHFNKLV